MKHIVFTDPHLGVHGNNSIWLNTTYKLFEEITDLAVKKDIRSIICLGDFFDNRRELNVKTINYAYDIAELLKDFTTYIIVGNHDTFLKKSLHPTSLRIFDKYSSLHVIDMPTAINNQITLIPWMEDATKARTPVVMGHFEINDMPMNQHIKFYGEGWDALDFTGHEIVLSGHFHTPSEKDNIKYIGATHQQSFNDVGSRMGYYIFDDDEYTLKFFQFTSAPKYIHLYSDEELSQEKIKGNIVKLIYKEELSLQENAQLIDLIYAYEPLMLTTDFSLVSCSDEEILQDESLEDSEIKDNQQLLFEFVDKIETPNHIKKPTLKKMIQNLEN